MGIRFAGLSGMVFMLGFYGMTSAAAENGSDAAAKSKTPGFFAQFGQTIPSGPLSTDELENTWRPIAPNNWQPLQLNTAVKTAQEAPNTQEDQALLRRR